MIDIYQHFNQQILIEQWCLTQGITNISVPDFTDHLCSQYGFLSDWNEIDRAYTEWSK